MPKSFQYYVLPAVNIPVFYRGEEMSRIEVPKTGEFSFEMDEELCKRITKGDALVRVLSDIVMRGDELIQGLSITSIQIEDLNGKH